MYITVRLINGWSERLLYKVPDRWSIKPRVGALVTVPLQKRFEHGLVESTSDTNNTAYRIKEAYAYEPILNDPLYHSFISKLSAYYTLDPVILYRRWYLFLDNEKAQDIEEARYLSQKMATTVILTDEQQAIVNTIDPFIKHARYQPFVLHGVTGSGKSEVYDRLIRTTHALGKSIILLLPEVSLAVQFVKFFKERYQQDIPVFGFHSATSAKEKRELWQHFYAEKPLLVIGVHLPVLLPLVKLGLIIVDEEHDTGYQEKKHPKINTKEAALLRAQLFSIPIVLGSATPSVTSLYNIQTRGWRLLSMHKRFSGAFPKIQIVKLADSKKRASFWISNELEEAIKQRLSKQEQVLIFINRRGYSFFVQCASCGFICRCTSCSVPLTFHEEGSLRCHYCGYSKIADEKCTSCLGTQMLKKGIGTQQVMGLLQRMFPSARVARADLDVTVNRKKWHQTLQSFYNRELDILVGTQTITKGYHFPNVTLVGILWADLHLSMPTYNAAETTVQQIIQVAGRAGRQHPESLVVVQTMISHSLLSYVDEVRYMDFYEHEIAQRSLTRYPPLVRFAEIELRHHDDTELDRESLWYVQALHDLIQSTDKQIRVLGPAQPPVHKVKNVHIRKIYLKGSRIEDLIEVYKKVQSKGWQSRCYFTPNPLTL